MDKKDSSKAKDTVREIEKKRSEISQAYLDMRMGKVKDVRSPRKLRKELAVMYTLSRNKELNKLNAKPEDAKDKADRQSNKK